MWGYVLVKVAAGKEPEFFSNLGCIEQVRGVFYLFDEYEYMVELEVQSVEEMSRVVATQIRRLPGVERTATYFEGNTRAISPVERAAIETPEPRLVW